MKKLRAGVFIFIGLGITTIARAASDVGAYYWIFKRADFVQTSTANPVPAGAAFHFTSFVQRSSTGSFASATSTLIAPGASVINTAQAYSLTGDGNLQYDTYLASQSDLDKAFAPGAYNLDIRGAMSEFTPTLFLNGNSIFPAEKPKITATNFKNGQLVVTPTAPLTLSWNSFADHDFVDDVIVFTVTKGTTTVIREVLAPGTTSRAFAANFFEADQSYVVEISFVRVVDKDTAMVPGSTGLTGFATTTRIYISTSSRAPVSGLANISTRGMVGTNDNVLISGFIITSTDSATLRVIIRAIGPSLTSAGIASPLQDPTIDLFDAHNHLIASNDNWRSTQYPGVITRAHLNPTDDRESALIRDLAPGRYTAVMRGKSGTTGVGLTEVYNLSSFGAAKLANISTRGQVLTNDQVMIGGLVVQGPFSHSILFRALGPSLANAGVSGVLANPTLQLFNAQGQILAGNDNWKDSQQAAIQATGIPPTNDMESAILRTLGPGSYTAIVRGKSSTTGIALIEAYALN
jgi:hypothetical protein